MHAPAFQLLYCSRRAGRNYCGELFIRHTLASRNHIFIMALHILRDYRVAGIVTGHFSHRMSRRSGSARRGLAYHKHRRSAVCRRYGGAASRPSCSYYEDVDVKSHGVSPSFSAQISERVCG